MISGVFTVQDITLYKLLSMLMDTQKIALEPSALAGMPGIYKLLHKTKGESYLKQHALGTQMTGATHIVWATGGNMVPPAVIEEYYKKGIDCRDAPLK